MMMGGGVEQVSRVGQGVFQAGREENEVIVTSVG
jgi:hypothetical protein